MRDLAREALQHHRSITAARPALSAALLPLMQALRQPPEQPSAAGRAASLVAAARPHAATAEAQVLSLPSRTPFPAHSPRSYFQNFLILEGAENKSCLCENIFIWKNLIQQDVSPAL